MVIDNVLAGKYIVGGRRYVYKFFVTQEGSVATLAISANLGILYFLNVSAKNCRCLQEPVLCCSALIHSKSAHNRIG